MVESARLESVFARKGNEGSNPSLSAIQKAAEPKGFGSFLYFREEGFEARQASVRRTVREREASESLSRGGHAALELDANGQSDRIPPSPPLFQALAPSSLTSLKPLPPSVGGVSAESAYKLKMLHLRRRYS